MSVMEYEQFSRKYLSHMNAQQREAVLAVEGPVLILATPGSGKTTVLVTRLGYMICCLGMDPGCILAMTYTKAAVNDMRERFVELFGSEPAEGLQFRTINGISSKIIARVGRKYGLVPFSLLGEEVERSRILRELWQRVNGEHAEESDIREAGTAITYIKNMMCTEEEIAGLKFAVANLPELYRQYQSELRSRKLMDYDDQLLYALRLLRRFPDVLSEFQSRYRYYCVDEAQDTSRVQHEMVRLLASRDENLFMVGDEDQSIYAFRAAYPDALMNFELDHPNARVLLIEENYRSTPEIIHAANRFIAQNRRRHKKTIAATRESGAPVHLIPVVSRESQFEYLLKDIPSWNRETAILFRNNDSALPLIDRFEATGIPYNCRNLEDVFFSHRVVRDIIEILRFSLDHKNTDIFLNIYYKFAAGISRREAVQAAEKSMASGITPFSALLSAPELKDRTRESVSRLLSQLALLSRDSADTAVRRIWENMHYGRYVERRGLDQGKYFILQMLSKGCGDIASFLAKLDRLKLTVAEHQNSPENLIILSTIHSSKGLEYDRVFLLDMLDGILPAKTAPDTEEEQQAYEEDRRLFYVAMTRARNELSLFLVGRDSSFPNEIARFCARRKKHFPLPAGKKTALDASDAFLSHVSAGSVVEHTRFGRGVVREIRGDVITITFETGGQRKFSLSAALRRGLIRYKSQEE